MCKCESTRKLAEAEHRVIELKSKCEDLRIALSVATLFVEGYDHTHKALCEMLRTTPEQSLVKHDAEVIRDAVRVVQAQGSLCDMVTDVLGDFTDYADKLEAGE